MIRQLVGDKEIIVADGGSSDDTITIAKTIEDVIVVNSHIGRANQMNTGAKVASGEVLLFLHCDSVLEPSALIRIETTIADTRIVGGCYTLKMDDNRLVFKFICLGSNIRARLSKVFFGDQGIFVRKSVFDELGGFPAIELMEDWEFSRKLREKGKTVQVTEGIITSTRRFKKGGVLKTCLFMHKLKILYLLGKTPAELKNKYYDVR